MKYLIQCCSPFIATAIAYKDIKTRCMQGVLVMYFSFRWKLMPSNVENYELVMCIK